MTERIKPIERTIYQCPIEGCKRILEGMIYEEAEAHVNQIPINLPRGLLYWDNRVVFRMVLPTGKLDSYHSDICNIRIFNALRPDLFSQSYEVSGRDILREIVGNKCSLLNAEEFDSVCRVYLEGFIFVDSPVRTTPELEELLARMGAEKK